MKNLQPKTYNRNSNQGFTLLEMIVAIGIFSIVSLISVRVVLTLNSVQKKAINVQNTHDNIRFALEAMARDIRTGENYKSGCDWPTGCNSFSFERSTTGGSVTYFLDTSGGSSVIKRQEGAGTPLPLTDPQRAITRLRFYVTGVAAVRSEQEKVTIVVEVESGIPTRQTEFANLQLQTTVSKRTLLKSRFP